MDFRPSYTPEQEAFRKEVRAWAEVHVPKIEGEPDSDENYAKMRQVGRELGKKGWLRPTAPKEYGGGGLNFEQSVILNEELRKRYPGIKIVDHVTMGATHGTNEREVVASIPDLLRKHGADAVISGVGA